LAAPAPRGFYRAIQQVFNGFRFQQWYIEDVKSQETLAHRLGFQKVSKMKLAVAQHIRDFCANGGFLFAMCSGTDSFDIALAAANTDICESMYDGDGADPDAQAKLDYSGTFAFQISGRYEPDVEPVQ
jgi:hypothetical protein